MLDKIELQILTALLRSETLMTSEELAFVTGKSSRTVRNRLKVINNYLKEYGSEVIMRPGIGIELVNEDESSIRRHLKELNRSSAIESDLKGLISLLVNHKEYLTHDEISDSLYISRSRLNKLINELQRIVSQYDLELETKQGYGIKINGSELNHRRFISSYYVQETWFNDSFSEYGYLDNESEEIQVINEMVTKVLQELSYGMSTSILVRNMKTEAEKIGYSCSIEAYAVDSVSKVGADADCILLGPQIAYKMDTVKAALTCPVKDIDLPSYGMMNGVKVLNLARTLMGDI